MPREVKGMSKKAWIITGVVAGIAAIIAGLFAIDKFLIDDDFDLGYLDE